MARRPFRSWFSQARPVPYRSPRRLGVERLEDRSVPATVTWTGASQVPGPKLWTDPFNWSGFEGPTVPVPGTSTTRGDDLVFPAVSSGAALNSVNDFPPDSLFGSIEFSGPGYTVSGNQVDLQGRQTSSTAAVYVQGDAATSNTLALPIRLVPFNFPGVTPDDFVILLQGTSAATAARLSVTVPIDNAGDPLNFSTPGPSVLPPNGADPQFNTYSITGGLTGAGDVTFAGATTTLGGTNTFGGALFLVGGTTTLAGINPIPDNAAVVMNLLENATGNPAPFPPPQLIVGTGGETIGSLATNITSSGAPGNGVVVIPAGATLTTGQDNTDTTYDGVISGGGALAKLGTGTFTLTNTNTYSGGTSVTGGVLSIHSDTNLGAVPPSPTPTGLILVGGTLQATASFTLNANRGIGVGDPNSSGAGTFDVTGSNTLIYGGTISDFPAGGHGGIIKTDNGTLTLTGTNAYSGGTVINGGFLSVSSDANLGFAPTFPTPNSLILVGSGALRATASFTINPNRGISLASGFADIDVTAGNTLTYRGVVADGTLNGTGTLVVNSFGGTGTLVLGGANTYSGFTIITSGVLSISSDANLGVAPTPTTPGDIRVLFGALQATASFTINPNRRIAVAFADIDVTAGNTLTYGGVIANSGQGSLEVGRLGGTGTLVLSGANTYSGGTTVSGGVLSVSRDANLGAVPTPPATGSINIASGTLQATGTFTLNPNRGIFLGNDNGSSGTIDVTAGNTLTYNGVIADFTVLETLLKTGTGTLVLGGANTYTGNTFVNGGVLSVSSDANLGAPIANIGAAITINGGTLQATSTFTLKQQAIVLGDPNSPGSGSGTIDVTQGNTLTPLPSSTTGGRLVKVGLGTLVLSGRSLQNGDTITGGVLSIDSDQTLGEVPASPTPGSLVLNGGTLLATATFVLNANRGISVGDPATSRAGTFAVAGGATLVYGGVITDSSGSGHGAVIESGGGLVLTGANTYSGGTTIFGTLLVGSDANLGAVPASPTPNIFINGGTLATAASFTLNANRIVALGPSSGGSNSGMFFVSGSDVLTINGVVADNGGLTGGGGTGRLVKVGSGTLVLTGASNSYSGGTEVHEGVLSISSDANLGAAPISPTPDSIALFGGELQAAGSFTLNANRGVAVGPASPNSGTPGSGTIGVTSGNTLTYGGVIANLGETSGNLVVNSRVNGLNTTGTLVLTGTNTYSGTTLIFAGVLSVPSDAALGAVPASPTPHSLILDGGALLATATFTLDPNRGVDVGKTSVGGGIIDVTAGHTLTYNGVVADTIHGPGCLVVNGLGDAGTLVLGGANTYSAGTAIEGGVLSVSRDANLGAVPASPTPNSIVVNGGELQAAGSFTLNANRGVALGTNGFSAIDVTIGNTLQIDGIVADLTPGNGTGGQLFKVDDGTLVLTANNTYTGSTNIFGGVLSVSRDANLGAVPAAPTPGALDIEGGAFQATASFTLNSNRGITGTITGADIDVTGTSTLTYNGVIADFGGGESATRLLKTGTGTLVLGGANTYSGGTTVSGGVLSVSRDANLGAVPASPTPGSLLIGGKLATTASFSINANRGIALNGSAFITLFNGNTVTYGGVIADAGNGPGRLFVDSGDTGGTLVLSGVNTYSGGTEVIGVATLSVSSDANLGTAPASPTPNSIVLRFGCSLLATASFTLNPNRGISVGVSGFDVTAGNTLTYGGVIAGTALQVNGLGGSGTLVLTGVNTYTGETDIFGGVLSVGSDANLGAVPASPTPSIFINGGTLRATASFTLNPNRVVGLGPLAGAGSGTIDVTGANTLSINGPIADTGSFSEGPGTGRLVKIGSGTLVLRGSDSYSGGTMISGGVLSISSDANLGAVPASPTPGSIVIDGATLQARSTFTLNANRGIALGPATGTGGGTIDVTAPEGPNVLTYGGVIADNGAADSLTKIDGGTLTLTGHNTYTGATLINGGTLREAAPGPSLPAAGGADILADVTDVTVASGAVFALNGSTDAINNLSGAGRVTLEGLGASGPNGPTVVYGTLTVGANNGSSTFAGTIGYTNPPTANQMPGIDLVKNGTGALTLSGDSNLAGRTTINQGSLIVTGNYLDLIDVNGGLLGGTGQVGNVIADQDGGTLSPGLSPGRLTAARSDSFLSGLTYLAELAGTAAGSGYDQFVAAAGGITLTNAKLQLVPSFTPPAGSTFDVILSAAPTIGTFNGLPDGAVLTVNGQQFRIDYNVLVQSPTGAPQFATRLMPFAAAPPPTTFVWDGMADAGGPIPPLFNNLFSNPLNWVGDVAPPTDGTADLVFPPGASQFNPFNDFTGAAFKSITVSGGYAITGNAVGLHSAGITANFNASGEFDLIALPLSFRQSSLTVTTTNASNSSAITGVLELDGAIDTTSAGGTVLNVGVNVGLVRIGGVIGGAGGLTKTGTSTLHLGAHDTYTGPTAIDAGTLQEVSANPSLPGAGGADILADATDVTVASGAVFDLNGATDAINGLSGAGRVNLDGVVRSDVNGTMHVFGTLTVGARNGSSTFAGTIGYTTPPSGQAVTDLVKVGTGSLTLSGNSDPAGQTVVRGGQLLVTGQYLDEIVLDGGTLGGTGQVSDVIAASGGTLSPGLSPGRLIAASAGSALNAGVTYLAELAGTAAGTSYDQFVAASGVNLGGAVLKLVPSFTAPTGATFDVVLSSRQISGMFAGLPNGATVTVNGQQFRINYNVSVTSSGGSPLFAVRLTKLGVVIHPATRFYAVGTGAGALPMVQVFNANGTPRATLNALDPRFRGGVRVAVGDVTGDSIDDVVAAAGPTGGPEVDLFDGVTGRRIFRFYAYDPSFRGGVHVAVGDVNGDGFADIITGEGSTGSPLVRVFSFAHGRFSVLKNFLAFAANYSGGVRVAAGDFDGDHRADIVCGTGTFPSFPEVKVFSGATGGVIRDYTDFSGNFANGVFVAVGDVNRDGHPDLIAGADAGFAPEVRVFDGFRPRLLSSFLAFDANFLGGVRVAGMDVNGDGAADVLAAPGAGGGSRLRVYLNGSSRRIQEVSAFNPSLTSSVYVGASDRPPSLTPG